MKGILSFLKMAYKSNKKTFLISLLIIATLIIVGCSTGQGIAPSGPIGGGCN